MKPTPTLVLGFIIAILVSVFGFWSRPAKSFADADTYKKDRQARVGAKAGTPGPLATVGGRTAQWYLFDRTGPGQEPMQYALDLVLLRENGAIESLGGALPPGYAGPSRADILASVSQPNADVTELPAPGSELSLIVFMAWLAIGATAMVVAFNLGVIVTRLLSLVAGVSVCMLIDLLAHQQTEYSQRLIVLAGLYITLAVSLNLINGITGQFSIGHAAFYQVGAYLTGFVTVSYFKGASIPPVVWLVLMLIVGAAGAGIAGFVVGLPSLRLKGDYLAIVTMGFGEIIRIEVQNTKALGGAYGMNVAPKIQPIWMVWMLAILCIAVCRNLIRTAHGLPFLAVREDEIASAAMGVNVTRVKVTAFVIGSMFAGAAGALLTHYEGFITGAYFSMDISFIILTMVVLGGTGSITGSAVAAAFLSYLPEQLRSLKNGDGTALTVTAASIAAALLAVVFAVAIIKRVMGMPQSKGVKALIYAGTIVGALLAKLAFQFVLSKIPALTATPIEAGQLRMVIFAVTLVVLMLLRPQGIFGHHEFSWSWVKKILGRRGEAPSDPEPAVAA